MARGLAGQLAGQRRRGATDDQQVVRTLRVLLLVVLVVDAREAEHQAAPPRPHEREYLALLLRVDLRLVGTRPRTACAAEEWHAAARPRTAWGWFSDGLAKG